MTDKEFIKIKQLSKNFEDVTAVDDVTVNIAKTNATVSSSVSNSEHV